MSIRQEKRTLERIKASLVEKYRDDPNGDILACNDFQVYLRLWASNVPLKYWLYEIADLTDADVRQRATAYVERIEEAIANGMGIYFSGNQGTGKTLVACVILKEAIRRGHTVYFTMLTEILEKYCDSRYDTDARAKFTQNILEAEILVVDDIDKGYVSERSTFIDSAYDYVFRKRANSNLPIIVTSNKNRTEFTNQKGLSFGQSLFSLFEEHLWDVYVCGRDRRRDIQKGLEEFFNG